MPAKDLFTIFLYLLSGIIFIFLGERFSPGDNGFCNADHVADDPAAHDDDQRPGNEISHLLIPQARCLQHLLQT